MFTEGGQCSGCALVMSRCVFSVVQRGLRLLLKSRPGGLAWKTIKKKIDLPEFLHFQLEHVSSLKT